MLATEIILSSPKLRSFFIDERSYNSENFIFFHSPSNPLNLILGTVSPSCGNIACRLAAFICFNDARQEVEAEI